MTIAQTSVSQIEKFDPEQGGCPRRWYLEEIQGLKPDQGPGAAAGESGHALLASYFRGEPLPKRAQLLKVVKEVILKGKLPKPGPEMLVELRFDGQEKFEKNGLGELVCHCGHGELTHQKGEGACAAFTTPDHEQACGCEEFSPKWNKLDREKTIWIGGLPLDGFIDLTYAPRAGGPPIVLDHKFSAQPEERANEKAGEHGEKLMRGIQMPVYAFAMMRRWPTAQTFWLYHHYINRTAGNDPFYRRTLVTTEQIKARIEEIDKLVRQMVVVSDAPSQDEVPFNRSHRSCHVGPVGLGCPMLAVCSAFKENKPMENLELSEGEAALFDDVPGTPAAAKPPPAEEDEIAKMEREHAEKMAALKKAAADKAKAAADAAKAAEEAKKPKCDHCGEALTSENASKLTSGKWKHVGCKKAPVDVLPPDAPQSDPAKAAEAKPEEKKGKKAAAAAPAGEITIILKADSDLLDVLKAIARKS